MDSPSEEEEMRKRRVGGWEGGMSRALGWSICSAAASAVNSHAWAHTHVQRDKHSPTHMAACRSDTLWWLLHKWHLYPLQQVSVSLVSWLFEKEEENPAGPTLCCSLCFGVCMRGRVRGRERGRESQRGSFLLRWYVWMMHQWRPRPLSGTANHHRFEICLSTDCRWLAVIIKKKRGWRSGWESGSGWVSHKVVINEEESRETRRGDVSLDLALNMNHRRVITRWFTWRQRQETNQKHTLHTQHNLLH